MMFISPPLAFVFLVWYFDSHGGWLISLLLISVYVYVGFDAYILLQVD